MRAADDIPRRAEDAAPLPEQGWNHLDATGRDAVAEACDAWTAEGEARATGRGDVRVLVRVLRPGSVARRARAVVREVLGQAGLPGDDVDTAELVVAELAANAERHARPPYELRIFSLDGVPAWCEMVDGDPDPREVRLVLGLLRSVDEIGLPLLAENGRGLFLAHRLSDGHCRAYPAVGLTTGIPGKAVAFALPTLSGDRLTG
ncbi:ATP-binding protein [Streptosporangium sp. DT93]|uniref:ATP-binding protein n=1 Tax=Streptosporangium sp. DT93 TaxID=3393428 RepID=UPI003CF7A62D